MRDEKRSYTNVSYSHEAFASSLDHIIYNFLAVTQDVQVGSLVGRGLSGALVIPTVARTLGIPFAIMRKNDESSHGSPGGIEGTITDNWVFFDDFVETGKTFQEVCNNLRSYFYSEPLKCAGLYQYQRTDEKLIKPNTRGFIRISRTFQLVTIDTLGGELDTQPNYGYN
jgi:hypothetical protein